MKFREIYELAIKKGIEKDPRNKSEIKKQLKAASRQFRKLKGADKAAFDRETLVNPYADTRMLYGSPDREIKKVIVGIDMEGPEILAADRLNERGESIDLVIAHHPEGKAWAGFYDVMRIQVAVLERFGIPASVGEQMLKERMSEVERAVAPANHLRSVDIARLLDMPYMCVHTPADNHVTYYLQKLFDKARPRKLSQVLSILKGIPEYADAMKKLAGPKILIGNPDKPAGKILVDMTGGTEGPKKVFARLSQAGVGTIVSMHLSEDHYKHAKGEHINVIIAGHIASDTLGLNLFFDNIRKYGEFDIIGCSGFVRVKR